MHRLQNAVAVSHDIALIPKPLQHEALHFLVDRVVLG